MQFKLPELGEGVHEGELVKWLVKAGDSVKFDQPLCEIMTDKATVEIPSAFQGKVAEFHAKEGSVVHVGQLMLSFEGTAAAGASASGSASPSAPAGASAGNGHAPAPQAQAASAAQAPAKQQAPAGSSASAPSGATYAGASASASAGGADLHPATRVLASPSTRRVAREMGVDLATIVGTGEHGRVLREDLTRGGGNGHVVPAAARKAPAPTGLAQAREERVAFRGLRKKISEKMRQSKDHAAHFTYVEEADATALVALRTQAKELGAKQGVKVTYLPILFKAMVAALKQYPILNSSLDEEKQELVYKHYYNISLSIQTDDGLTAPVIKDVDQKSIFQLAREIEDVVNRARAKKLTVEDFQGGTITLTNAGTIGGLFATPVINYPEVAILGFNKIFRKPVVKVVDGEEKIVIRDWTYFSISLDHRVVDGAIGAEFMKTFIQYIENPGLLVLA